MLLNFIFNFFPKLNHIQYKYTRNVVSLVEKTMICNPVIDESTAMNSVCIVMYIYIIFDKNIFHYFTLDNCEKYIEWVIGLSRQSLTWQESNSLKRKLVINVQYFAFRFNYIIVDVVSEFCWVYGTQVQIDTCNVQ
jgi:hypothetical protein